MPRNGEITATVDLIVRDPGRRHDPTAPVKLRLVIWSGPDFRTPTIHRGGLYEDPAEARAVAEQLKGALRVAGIPIEGDSDHAQALLAPVVG